MIGNNLCLGKVGDKNGNELALMIALASLRHYGTFDKGGNPYILHPMKVMYLLKSDDRALQSIAVGHDLLEDTSTTVQELEDMQISPRVIAGIVALTKWPGQTQEQYKQAVFANPDAMRVKLCDLRHNSDLRRLKGVTEKDLERVRRYHLFYSEIEQRLSK